VAALKPKYLRLRGRRAAVKKYRRSGGLCSKVVEGPRLARAIVAMAQATKRDGNERGAAICARHGVLSFGEKVTGSGHSVRTRTARCPAGKRVGSFHTHGGGSSTTPSPGDWASTTRSGDRLMCIGAASGKGKASVSCYSMRGGDVRLGPPGTKLPRGGRKRDVAIWRKKFEAMSTGYAQTCVTGPFGARRKVESKLCDIWYGRFLKALDIGEKRGYITGPDEGWRCQSVIGPEGLGDP